MNNNRTEAAKLPAIVRHLAGAAALLGLTVSFWWWRILAPAAADGPIGALCSDLYTQYIPVLARAAQELRGGHLPLWNPDQLAGVPALPSWFAFGAFYPLNALFLVLPPQIALGWTACLHLGLAGAGMYWLARSLDLSPPSARLAAVTYMLSLPLATQPNLFIAMTLAPAVLASWVRLTLRPARRAVAVAAALTALQFSSGGTQIFLYTLYALALLLPFVFFAAAPHDRSWRRPLAVALAALLTAGLVAVLLLPTLASLEVSSRATGRLTLAETVPFPTRTLRELGRELLDPTPGPPRLFFGWTALALALLGAVRPVRRTAWPGIVLVLLAGTLLVLGPNTPAYEWYYRLPTGDWFRSPERAAVLVALGIAQLAAHGVECLRRRGWRTVAALLFLLPAAELFHATWNWLPYPQLRSAAAMAPPLAAAQIPWAMGPGRAYVAMNWQDRFPFMEKLGTWQRVRVAQDYDSLTPAIYGDYFRTLIGPAGLVDPVFQGRYHPLFGTRLARRALNMLAVNIIVVAPGAQIRWRSPQRNDPPAPTTVIFANRGALPRAFVVHRVEVAGDEQQALRRIADLRFDPASTAVVVGGEAIESGGAVADDKVEFVTAEPDTLVLRAWLSRRGLLVLSDLMFPGWEAHVDSTPTPIVRTNALFRGVYLDAGEHRVEFAYRPPSVLLGLSITALSVVVLLMMTVASARLPRPPS